MVTFACIKSFGMIFSQMCKIGIKASIYIALSASETALVTIKNVASHINESPHTIGKILQLLSRNHVLNSVKGAHGGFYMTKRQKMKPILDIVRIVDGDTEINGCVLGLQTCSATKPCPIHFEYLKAKKEIEEILNKKNIGELAELVKDGARNLLN
jgi:Rrf2 family protein